MAKLEGGQACIMLTAFLFVFNISALRPQRNKVEDAKGEDPPSIFEGLKKQDISPPEGGK